MTYKSNIKKENWDGSYETHHIYTGEVNYFCRHGLMRPICKRCYRLKYFLAGIASRFLTWRDTCNIETLALQKPLYIHDG